MQKKTRSLLEELDAMYIQRDQRHVMMNLVMFPKFLQTYKVLN